MIKLEVDRETSAIYIHLTDNEVARTVELCRRDSQPLDDVEINLDVDADGKVVGVEII